MARNRIILATAGIMLSLFLASMESAAVLSMFFNMSPLDEASAQYLVVISRRPFINTKRKHP